MLLVLTTIGISADYGVYTERPNFYIQFGTDNYQFFILDSGDEVSLNQIYPKDKYTTNSRIVLPEEVTYEDKTYRLVEIEPEAFQRNTWLWDLVYPSTLRKVGKRSFYGSNLRSFKPNGESNLKIIDDSAFATNTIWDIDLGNKIEKIGNSAFQGFNFISVKIPDSVTSLGQYAFASNKLKSITIGNGLTYICGEAFSKNPVLQTVVIGKNVKTIDHNAFKGCNLQNLTIPDNVQVIGEGAFAENEYLTSVKFPSALENIPDNCFSGCKTIMELNIPASVKTIGTGAFHMCTGLNYLYFEENSQLTSIGHAAFSGSAISQLKMPDTVEEIGNGAFQFNTSLVSVYLSSHMKSIGKLAFAYCDEIRDITCYAMTPPAAFVDCFQPDVYDNARLWVDKDASKLYKRDEVWRLFINMEGVEGASIDEIDVDTATAPILYNLSGHRLSDAEAANPTRGIYIEKRGKTARKILVTE